MKIERIKIDGFGRFERWGETLAPGLNIVFGPNEAGKSTLLSFVRATLFGFSRRAEPSRYEPERGPFGGELLLATRAGPLWVRRMGSRRRYEGELSLRGGGGERALPSRLAEAMGGISRQLFFQVFAFGLDQLAEFDQLAEQGDIAEALFAAGMRGAKRLPFALDELRRSSEGLFTPKGKRELNQLLAELEAVQERLRAIGDRPADYFHKLDELTAIEKKLQSAEEQALRLSEERGQLAKLDRASEDLAKLQQLERELELFPPLDAFPVDATRELEKLSRRRADAAAEVQAAASERESLALAFSGIAIPEPWATAESEMRAALDAFGPRVEQLRSVKARSAETLQRQVELVQSLQALGASFKSSELLRMDLTPEARDRLWAVVRQLQSARSRIASTRERSAAAATAIERAEREVLSVAAKPTSAPRSVLPRSIVPSLWMLLAAIAVAGPVLFAVPITWLTLGLTGLIAAVLFAFERWAAAVLRQAMESFEASQTLTARRLALLADQIEAASSQKVAAEEEEAAANAELARLAGELCSWLKERKLPPGASAERALELWVELSALQLRLRDLLTEEQALAAEERACREAKEQLEGAARRAGIDFEDVEGAQRAVSAALERIGQAREGRHRLSEQLESNAARLDRARKQCAEVEALVAQFLQQAGCTSEEELRILDRQAEAFRALRLQSRELVLRIEATTGAAAPAVREEVRRRGGRTSIEEALSAIDGQLEQLALAKADLAESRGRCRAQLEHWEEDREIAALRKEEERLRAQASALAEEYAVDRLALRLLSEAQRRFEQEQQPRILQLASRAFQELTGGRYVRVYASASEPGSLRVDQADGREWADEQLSRGTREQLYLAFRLAVIEDFGESRLPLPIILDDVLVNFDHQRARNVVKVLARLAARHQVIAFTCHEEVRELFAEQGARVIEIARDWLGLLAATA